MLLKPFSAIQIFYNQLWPKTTMLTQTVGAEILTKTILWYHTLFIKIWEREIEDIDSDGQTNVQICPYFPYYKQLV